MPILLNPSRPLGRDLPTLVTAFAVGLATAASRGDGDAPAQAEPEAKPAANASKDPAPAAAEDKGQAAVATLLKDATRIPGLVPLWRKEDALHAELPDNLLGKDFFVLTSIARGIGDRSLLGGMSLGFGDDWVWQFRKVDNAIQVVRRNVRFFAAKGSPEAKAVDLAYTDSVLFSVPIKGRGPGGGHLIDLAPIFLTDLPRISADLPGFSFARDRSTWGRIKNFADNVELEVAATYGSSGATTIDTVPDSRGVTLAIRYSISLLPENAYVPRLADDRVGYFVTALKDFSQQVDEDRFVRYINRWHLEKADPKADLSPPKKPIVFWIENTVPFRYRPAIRRGIEAWNEAFEKAGFAGAIEVRQQPDKTDWDPEDVNYNTFRWITAGQGLAMGPSRVNPRTGQILDADIIFDADFLQFWRREYETFTPEGVALLTGGGPGAPALAGQHCCGACALFAGHARETALAATVLAVSGAQGLSEEEKEKLVVQGLTQVAMHEVGHTLGLRHNFKGSAFRSIADFNDVTQTTTSGGSTSVMDYVPVNIMPKGKTQGEYYAARLGPYDLWAIEYGYTPVSGGSPEAERPELEKIAAKSGEPQLAYATDEDTEWGDPDPLSSRFDLGRDPIEFARVRAELVAQVMPGIVERMTKADEDGGYGRVRQAFGILLATHGQAMYNAARLVGGLYGSRSHRGDANAQPPFRVVEAAKQREALGLLAEKMFAAEPFSFPPELYNQLASTRWLHWGASEVGREDYPVHEVILMWQDRVLSRLLDPLVLDRIRDNELKVAADQDALTTAELFDTLGKAVMQELTVIGPGEYSPRKPAITSLRRGLQRAYVSRLAGLAMAGGAGNPDAQALAAEQLRSVDAGIEALLAKQDVTLDAASRAHLGQLRARIEQVLDADLVLPRP
ncbi:MAG: zinc-dependent metalloprotease [Planctomycetota bacterium]